MSAEPLITPKITPEIMQPGPSAAPLPWGLFRRQLTAILRLEVKKSFFGKRALGLYALAAMPVVIFALHAIVARFITHPNELAEGTKTFATLYQTFLLRLVIFFGCVEIFGNLIRREMLERTLHYYFLSPVRREVLASAKYLTGLLVAFTLFGGSTIASFVLSYVPFNGLDLFFFHGPGFAHLLAYVFVTFLACLGYGAVFLAFGFFFKSPAIPAVIVFGWEGINFLLPPLLKKISMIHYLESLCPVPISLGPFALPADAPSPWLAVPGIFLLTAALLAISGWKVRRMEISYEED
jgi:ABC-type transport system involved in multi-copper enzyme maturation permease subunit